MKRVCSLAVVLAAAAFAQADELYRQNPVQAVGGTASQDARNPGGLGLFAEVSDNFTLAADSTVTQIEFWGGYVSQTAPPTDGFMIRIYNDAGGSVGTRITSQDILTFTEVADYTNASGARFHTTVNLNTPVQLEAGQYWLSVVAILPLGGSASNPQWGWVGATNFTPPLPRQIWFGSPIPTNNDVSFVINGNVGQPCGTADFNGDGDVGTDADIEAFFLCLAGTCCQTCWHLGADFNADSDIGTDADIEAFFRVLAGNPC